MLFDQIASNKRKTWILLLVFFLLSSGWLCGWLSLYKIRSWWFGYRTDYRLYLRFVYDFQSTEIVMSMNGAREVDEQTAQTSTM